MSTATPAVSYTIVPKSPEAHLFAVTLTVHKPDSQGQVFTLPAWIPGSYMIRDFAKNIVTLRAESTGQPVQITKLDKQTWQCAPCSGPLTLSYEVYAWDLSVRTAHLDSTHGYFNGTSVFLCAKGLEHDACRVDILRPAGDQYKDWKVATAMPRFDAEAMAFGSYQCADYDELIDHPVEMGDFTHARFEACGVPHDIVITGKHYADMDRLCADLKPICEQHIRFFGEPAPVDYYLFQVMVVGDGYGGLEHRASTSLLCSRDDLPRKGMQEVSNGYRNFLGLCSHEYFHTWNVKRIKPKVFLPYKLQQETYTELLWVFEGFTSYYDELGLVRSGVLTAEKYLQMLSETVTRVWRNAGRFKQSVAESSFDAWTKFYKQDENAPNAIVSYYTKGALVALALDLTLRQKSEGKVTLDAVMQHLWKNYGAITEGLPEKAIETIVQQLLGESLDAFFASYVYGCEDPPLQSLLADVGVELAFRAAENQNDFGGKEGQENNDRLYLGGRVARDPLGAKVTQVFENGPLQQAGVAAGDVLIALDGLQLTSENLDKRLANFSEGKNVELVAFRRDELMRFNLTLQSAPSDTCVLRLTENVEESVLQKRIAWLRG